MTREEKRLILIFKRNLGECSRIDIDLFVKSILISGKASYLSSNVVEVEGFINEEELDDLAFLSTTLKDIVSVISVRDVSECLELFQADSSKRPQLADRNHGIKILVLGGNKENVISPIQLECIMEKFSRGDFTRDKIYPAGRKNYLILSLPEKKAYLGVLVRTVRRDRLIYRSPEKRAFAQFSALNPKTALFLVNLSTRLRSEKTPGTLLDPFCGSGGILIEAALMGYYTVGLEIYYKPIRGARRNIIQYGLYENVDLVLTDAVLSPFREKSFDAIVFDPPYGRLAPVKSCSSPNPLPIFIGKVRFLLKSGGTCVFLYPSNEENERITSLGFKEACRIFEHSTLTRSVWCFKNER